MANYKVTDTQLSSIADAIRSAAGTSEPMVFPSGFVSAISDISSGAVLGSKTILANGEYLASADNLDGFDMVTVSVPQSGITPTGSINISQNGTYDVSAFADAVVNVGGGGGGSNDNFLIAIGAMSGSIYDIEASVVGAYGFAYRNSNNGMPLTGVEMTAVESINTYAFWNCSSLSEAKFPMCTIIGNSAFSNCTTLTSISFPACITIQIDAFRATALSVASFPVCKTIGSNAFSGCYSLTSANFPMCESIGSNAFSSCSSLTSVSFPACTSISGGAFAYCSRLSSVNFPMCITVGNAAFINCSSLQSVDLPACTIISNNVFSNCYALKNISLPACTLVNQSAFYRCSALASISLPVCSIVSASAFHGCSALESVYMLSTSVAVLYNENAFASTPILQSSYLGYFGSIYVPSSLVDAYKSAARWSTYADRITAYEG